MPKSGAALDKEQVYFVQSDQDPTALLARRAGVRDGWVFWDDTSRDRVHRVAGVKKTDGAVEVTTEPGYVYRFQPLTLELYDAQVRAHVELSPDFPSTEEVVRFYQSAEF